VVVCTGVEPAGHALNRRRRLVRWIGAGSACRMARRCVPDRTPTPTLRREPVGRVC